MLSLDKYPDWSTFAERDVLECHPMFSPSALLVSDLQVCEAVLQAKENLSRVTKQEFIKSLIPLIRIINQLDRILAMYASKLEAISEKKADVYRHLRVLKDQMNQEYSRLGFEIVDPTGQPFEAVADRVDVRHWRHDESFSMEIVDQVLEPIILYNNVVVDFGTVIMGAPPEQAIGE